MSMVENLELGRITFLAYVLFFNLRSFSKLQWLLLLRKHFSFLLKVLLLIMFFHCQISYHVKGSFFASSTNHVEIEHKNRAKE